MDAIEKIADWLGEQPFARNRTDYTDEQRTFVEVDVEHLADCLIAAFPQLALEGRKQFGVVQPEYGLSTEQFVPVRTKTDATRMARMSPIRKAAVRTEWIEPWSEVQS